MNRFGGPDFAFVARTSLPNLTRKTPEFGGQFGRIGSKNNEKNSIGGFGEPHKD